MNYEIVPTLKSQNCPDISILQKMLVAFLLLVSASLCAFSGLSTASGEAQPLPISWSQHLSSASSNPLEAQNGGPMSLNGLASQRLRRWRGRRRRRRRRGRRNIAMVSRPWRPTGTSPPTSNPMSLYNSFGVSWGTIHFEHYELNPCLYAFRIVRSQPPRTQRLRIKEGSV